jgi:carbohydrate kinase (thermoresistant glucokinase family)
VDAGVVIVVMGVAGSGKSAVGARVAAELGVTFVDADDFHDPASVESMRAGKPLGDEQRGPWLVRLNEVLRERQTAGTVVACSALRRAYRDALRSGVRSSVFVYLAVSEPTLTARLAARTGHFAGADLLSSQLATLELGDDVVAVDGELPIAEVVDAVLAAVAGG